MPRSIVLRLLPLAAPLGLALALSPSAPEPTSLPRAQDAAEDDPEGQAFQVYDTQAVRARVESAREHLDARRWSEALVDLQGLLEEHWGEVLPASRPKARLGRDESLCDVHGGAGAWARETLAGMPPEAQGLYQERFGARAARAFEAAISSGDRVGLTAVAMRWPITAEARRAWWALGDLELELGNAEAGRAAWARAFGAELAARGVTPESDPVAALASGDPERWRAALELLHGAAPTDARAGDQGLEARVAFAIERLGQKDWAGRAGSRSATALQPGGESMRLGRQVDGWPREHPLAEPERGGVLLPGEHPFQSRAQARYSLYPAIYGDKVFYSTSRALVAVGAYTGEVEWRTPPDLLGWPMIASGAIAQTGTFDKAIELDDSLVQPAAAQGVVVAALQIPVAFEGEDSYGDLEIIKVIPDRRLFAFDSETGELLWETLPPAQWDGESGTFAERMSIVGPPTISGSRVLVPAARVRGRVEMFLGCFDLHSGEVLWSAPLITGQRPLNMFGRMVAEYAAPPAVVAGERVLVATQLGTVACLDLFTGETLWQSLYPQIPILAGNYYQPGLLNNVWDNAPPAVADDVVVVAPYDGYDLLGLDLGTGAVLWSVSARELTRRMGNDGARVQVLLGADDSRVYLGGQKLAAFRAPGGLAREEPLRRDWVYPASEATFRDRQARPVLTRDRIYLSGSDSIEIVDRRDGRLLDEIADANRGNPLVTEGMTFVLSTYTLNGYFEWESMTRHARERLAAAPGSPDAVLELARVLYKRGLSATARAEFREAARYLQEARQTIEGLGGSDGPESAPALRTCLFDVLRAEGRMARLAADPRAAVRSLRQARDLAPDQASRRDVLLEEAEVLRGRDANEWRATLDLLAETMPAMPVEVVVVPGAVPSQPWVRLEPTATSAARDEFANARPRATLPMGLWVLVESAAGSGGRADDGPREFADLHAILQRYADVPLPSGPPGPPGPATAGAWARDRIAAKLAAGQRDGYGPFAERADELLRSALETGDVARLAQVGELYPFSPAAERANEARVESFLETGALDQVVRVVLDELPAEWRPSAADARQVRALTRLAAKLGEAGNVGLRAAWARSLARDHGDLALEMDGAPTTLAALAGRWGEAARPPAPLERTFDAVLGDSRTFPGQLPYQPLGPVPASDEAGAARAVHLFTDDWDLYALGTGAGPEPLWSRGFGDPRQTGRSRETLCSDPVSTTATSPGRVHVGTTARILTLDRDSGRELWSFPAYGIDAVAVDSGLVLVHHELGNGRPRTESGVEVWTALDAVTGLELWSRPVSADLFHTRLALGDGTAVLLPFRSGRAEVLDLFTGHTAATFDLDSCLYRTANCAWVQDGRICLPFFHRDPRSRQSTGIRAFDLATGGEAWQVSFEGLAGRDWELKEIFSFEGENALLLSPAQPDPDAVPGLFSLNVGLGALSTRPVADVTDGRLLGAGTQRRTQLDSPYVFALERESDGVSYAVHALHLRYGERWSARLGGGNFTINASEVPTPAVSDTTVAIVLIEPDGRAGSRQRRPRLLCFDRTNGAELLSQPLPAELFGTTAPIQLDSLGTDLVVCGWKMMQWLR